jgi:hypothetical protein
VLSLYLDRFPTAAAAARTAIAAAIRRVVNWLMGLQPRQRT